MGLDRRNPSVYAVVAGTLLLVVSSPAFGQLVTGTSINASGTSNDVYEIDVMADIATALFFQPVWGATYDIENDRVIFTSDAPPGPSPSGPPTGNEDQAPAEGGIVGGAHLYEYVPAEGTTNYLGDIVDGGGVPFRIDGLAISDGTLYGSRAAAFLDGIYEIDMTTLEATLVLALTDSISGIDADPDTGTIYGVNDTDGQLVTIDVGGGTVTDVAAYPDAAEGDIDGIAVGGGKAYMIPDDNAPGLIYVYDIDSGTFDTPLTAPWGATADIFSGGAYLAPPEPDTPIVEIPTLGSVGLVLLLVLLAVASIVLIQRRKANES